MMGAGLSVSGTSTFSSIRFTGREVGDPLGVLESESNCMIGGGSQTHGAGRWGDYSSISVDPVDQCTFWLTNEYLPGTDAVQWRTRVCSFRFASCSPPPSGAIFAAGFECGDTKVWSDTLP
jgi:hypothetical protein